MVDKKVESEGGREGEKGDRLVSETENDDSMIEKAVAWVADHLQPREVVAPFTAAAIPVNQPLLGCPVSTANDCALQLRLGRHCPRCWHISPRLPQPLSSMLTRTQSSGDDPGKSKPGQYTLYLSKRDTAKLPTAHPIQYTQYGHFSPQSSW